MMNIQNILQKIKNGDASWVDDLGNSVCCISPAEANLLSIVATYYAGCACSPGSSGGEATFVVEQPSSVERLAMTLEEASGVIVKELDTGDVLVLKQGATDPSDNSQWAKISDSPIEMGDVISLIDALSDKQAAWPTQSISLPLISGAYVGGSLGWVWIFSQGDGSFTVPSTGTNTFYRMSFDATSGDVVTLNGTPIYDINGNTMTVLPTARVVHVEWNPLHARWQEVVAPVSSSPYVLTVASPVVINAADHKNFKITATSNLTFGPITNASPGDSGMIWVVQDSTGGWSLTLDSTQIDMNGTAADVATLAANGVAHIGWATLDGVTFEFYISIRP